ncbi:acyl-CoA dehydrogenase family protein [Streptacidiphilus sp. P02-A3a]|uniref:acyl-CoA dehydrogenase family protein n=1 Tax=Streptacidiphilus sp. P02-A3a TaxID=2704468 RepID=UPI0015FC1152|nr:acyl-CoA dehydrogenase family protein [Streptacidiphilus sp. P02-A3a]QMU71310.1 acyl-CoA/acyl-ACP dehydrogenase [Streptacidiphilus sp. P02-A3a]
MILLATERDLLERALPGFDERLAALGTDGADDPDSGVVEEFRAAGGGNLLIPAGLGGAGLGCLEGVRLQRAVGSRAPALAVGSTMHHYKVAWLARELDGPVAASVLRRVAAERQLVASCGAEGRVGGSLFTPGIEVSALPDGLRISGTKRPCSLVRSMGLLSLLAAGPEDSAYAGQLVNVLVPADAPGVSRQPFWRNRVLRAAQTDAVVLDGVHVADSMIVPVGLPSHSAQRITSNMLWFQLLITAAYLGVATGQVERLFRLDRGTAGDRIAALAPLESVAAALESAARELDAGRCDDDLLGRVLLTRYTAQRAIAEATDRVLELLGGMAFVTGGEGAEALLASRALAFHPPAESAMREPLDHWLRGDGLVLA